MTRVAIATWWVRCPPILELAGLITWRIVAVAGQQRTCAACSFHSGGDLLQDRPLGGARRERDGIQPRAMRSQ